MIGKQNKKTTFTPARGKVAKRKQMAAIKRYYSVNPKRNNPLNFVTVLLKRHGDNKGGHHHVILDDIDDKHVSVGLTTQKKKGKNSTNYNCKSDVLGNGKFSYMRRQGTVDRKENYFEPKSGKMTKEAYDQAQIYGDRAKQKYLAQKKEE